MIDKLCERYRDAISMAMCFIYVLTDDSPECEAGEVIALCKFFAEANTIIFNNVHSSQHFDCEIMEYIGALFLVGIIEANKSDDKILIMVGNEKEIKKALDYMDSKLNRMDDEPFSDFLVNNFSRKNFFKKNVNNETP